MGFFWASLVRYLTARITLTDRRKGLGLEGGSSPHAGIRESSRSKEGLESRVCGFRDLVFRVWRLVNQESRVWGVGFSLFFW